ncbi:hypothetical protein [Allocoleopsis sp.]|uniref:hypothetical protein n=1 Tax=Allocoleopsis sp. TaxID=3088169 RepID=UPI002FD2D19E
MNGKQSLPFTLFIEIHLGGVAALNNERRPQIEKLSIESAATSATPFPEIPINRMPIFDS